MARKTLQIGIFGVWRGNAYIKSLKLIPGVKVTAICDKNPEKVAKALPNCPEDVRVCETYDELLDSGIDAVVICNYFPEHAEAAVKALKKGIHVCSETMAASTMAGCVKLVEAVRESKCIYMLAENYPFSKGCMELRRVCETGTLGDITFAEGEYVHPMSPSESLKYTGVEEQGEYHWRRYLPATYYSSHAMMPLMYMTGLKPKKVIGKVAKCTPENIKKYSRTRGDAVGVMLVEMDNGAIFRINGSSYIAPHGNWYRIGGTEGGVETVRGDSTKVRLSYNKWSVPEGFKENQIYEAAWPNHAKQADACGHGGGDYWIMKHFIKACRRGRADPRLDVYHATAMAAVSILGWRSVLNGSKEMRIPDFAKVRDRQKWANDTLTPFATEEEKNTLPYTFYPVERE